MKRQGRLRPELAALTIAGTCAAVLLIGGPLGVLPQARGTDQHRDHDHDSRPAHHHHLARRQGR